MGLKMAFGQRLSKLSCTLGDILQRWKHPVYSGHPKVLTSMLSNLNIQQGDIILECGAGNGVGTALLARAVGSSGHVYSIDKLPKSIKTVKTRLDKLKEVYTKETGVPSPDNVTLFNTSVQDIESFSIDLPKHFDLIFVDIGEPASSLKILSSKLAPGKCLAIYLPSVNRIVELLEAVKLQSLPLVLQGVWEESSNVVTFRNSLSPANFHPSVETPIQTIQNTENLKEYGYELNASLRDETTTAFLVKFCRVSTNSDMDTKLTELTFQYEDNVLLTPVSQPKKGKHRSVVVRLIKGKKFYNDWGSVCLDDIISLPPGSLIQTSAGQSLYLKSPSCTEVMSHGIKVTQRLSVFLSRFHHLLSFGANVCPGCQVLEISSHGTALTHHLSDIVGEQGHVYSVTEDNKLLMEMERSCNLSGHHNKIKCVTVLKIDDMPNLINSGVHTDAVILTPSSPEEIETYIKLGFNALKCGKAMAIFCSSLEHVSRVLRHSYVKCGQLVPRIVYEDKDRPWVVKSPERQSENGEILYYICRPKHGEPCPTGYVIVLMRR